MLDSRKDVGKSHKPKQRSSNVQGEIGSNILQLAESQGCM